MFSLFKYSQFVISQCASGVRKAETDFPSSPISGFLDQGVEKLGKQYITQSHRAKQQTGEKTQDAKFLSNQEFF